jgi:hypothetical protein
MNNLGFHLYRAAAADGPRTRITDTLLAGMGTGDGQSYAWTDGSLPESGAYYWLEDVDLDGTRTLHGPVRVGAPPSAVARGFVAPAGAVCRIGAAALQAAGLDVTGVDGSLIEVRVGGSPVAAYCSAQGRTMEASDYVLFYAGGPAAHQQMVSVALAEDAARMETAYAGPLYEALPALSVAADAAGLTPVALAGMENLVAVNGLEEADSLVLDVTNPEAPRLLLGAEMLMQAEGLGLFLSPAEWIPASLLVIEPRAVIDLPAP